MQSFFVFVFFFAPFFLCLYVSGHRSMCFRHVDALYLWYLCFAVKVAGIKQRISFFFLLLCFWARIHVLLVSGCCIFVASLFCHKDSRIQAIYWHKNHVSMLTVTSCPMFWYEKCSPSCLIFGVIICSKNGRTQF
jgi:hypothetical protein